MFSFDSPRSDPAWAAPFSSTTTTTRFPDDSKAGSGFFHYEPDAIQDPNFRQSEERKRAGPRVIFFFFFFLFIDVTSQLSEESVIKYTYRDISGHVQSTPPERRERPIETTFCTLLILTAKKRDVAYKNMRHVSYYCTT